MRSRRFTPFVLLLALAGCAGNSDRVELIAPVFQVRQAVGQITPSQYSESNQVELQVDIHNRSAEPITLRRLQLQPVIGGPFQFRPVGKIFGDVIAPNTIGTFELWVDARLESYGPSPDSGLRVRGVAIFDSDDGTFRRVFLEDVIESSDRPVIE